MFTITLNSYERGLVYKNNDLIDILGEGTYFKPFNTKIKKYNVTELFKCNLPWEIIEKKEFLMKRLNVVDIKDNEIVIEKRKGRFHRILTGGRYAYWKDAISQTFDYYDTDEAIVPKELINNSRLMNSLKSYMIQVNVLPNEKALLYVNDKLTETLDGGVYYFWNNSNSIKIERIDVRQQLLEIAGQELLTKDKATLRINFDLMFNIIDINKALVDNKDYKKQLYTFAQMALREHVGEVSLDELLMNKKVIENSVLEYLKTKNEKLGVEVNFAGIRDIILPGDVKEIMNEVLIAQKQAQARSIFRREETASTRSLLNTAKLMEDNAMLFRLKEMEYVEKISEKIGKITLSGNGGMVKQLNDIFCIKK